MRGIHSGCGTSPFNWQGHCGRGANQCRANHCGCGANQCPLWVWHQSIQLTGAKHSSPYWSHMTGSEHHCAQSCGAALQYPSPVSAEVVVFVLSKLLHKKAVTYTISTPKHSYEDHPPALSLPARLTTCKSPAHPPSFLEGGRGETTIVVFPRGRTQLNTHSLSTKAMDDRKEIQKKPYREKKCASMHCM